MTVFLISKGVILEYFHLSRGVRLSGRGTFTSLCWQNFIQGGTWGNREREKGGRGLVDGVKLYNREPGDGEIK